MQIKLKKIVRALANKLGYDIVRAYRPNEIKPSEIFHSLKYLRFTALKLEHLASLRIPVAGMSVLEVGAGIGDHSRYYIDRGCSITITEARSENLKYLKMRYPHINVQFMDMERPSLLDSSPFDITHCYGLLYHLKNPEQALEFISNNTNNILFLETCVSFGETEELNPVAENQNHVIEAYSGGGCRPTRSWVFNRLQALFKYVYIPKTQPNYDEFPIDWIHTEKHKSQKRAVFIASREKLENEMLIPFLINKQERHE